jgi:hydrogenase/urease accessory protein HupE
MVFITSTDSVKAHEIRPAYLQIVQKEQNIFEVYWKVPRMGDAVPRIQPVFPTGSELELLTNPNQTPDAAIYSYILTSPSGLRGQEISIKGLNRTLIDALVTISFSNGEKVSLLLQADKDSAIIPGEARSIDVIKTYVVLGIEHILLGIDHLLFVLALILITKGKWKILKTITAFTIAHSITLSLAALGLVSFPGAPVEAVIALSIVFLARELLQNLKGRETLTGSKPWIVAFVFGLLHGFGFAGALTEIGLPQQDIPLALAFFNIGVEIGQIIFVVVVLFIAHLLGKKAYWPVFLRKAPAYAIGAVASFWVIERVLSFWE